jgi:formylglycine-generating enzyme required for sulfatase activity
MNYPWAYDNTSGDWYYFNPSDTQWVVRMPTGPWAKLQHAALSTGWAYFSGAYVYATSNLNWHWINNTDTQWVVNMRTTQWSRLGAPEAPAGMVLIPSGTNAGTDPEFGAYSLTVERFYMDRHEVTKALWDEVRAWAASRGYPDLNEGAGKAATHPVHDVSWYDCVKWCNARSEKDGRETRYYTDAAYSQVYRSGVGNEVFVKPAASGYGLPTEVEWMYAARGGVSDARFPWGTDTITHTQANYYSVDTFPYDLSPTRDYHPTYAVGDPPYTSPVGVFAPNGYGLYDMAGNIYEWCWDGSPPPYETWRVLRGGSWNGYAGNGCVIGWRSSALPTVTSYAYGFRTVAYPTP